MQNSPIKFGHRSVCLPTSVPQNILSISIAKIAIFRSFVANVVLVGFSRIWCAGAGWAFGPGPGTGIGQRRKAKWMLKTDSTQKK